MMRRVVLVAVAGLLPAIAVAQQQPVGGAGAAGGPNGAGITAPRVQAPGLGAGVIKPATPSGTATATGANAAGGVPNGPNSPATSSGNAGAGGGVSPAQQ